MLRFVILQGILCPSSVWFCGEVAKNGVEWDLGSRIKQAPWQSKGVSINKFIHVGQRWQDRRRRASRFWFALISSCLPAPPAAAAQGCQQMLCWEAQRHHHEEPTIPPGCLPPSPSQSSSSSWMCLGPRFPWKSELAGDFSLMLQLLFPDLYFPSSFRNYVRSISSNKFLIP